MEMSLLKHFLSAANDVPCTLGIGQNVAKSKKLALSIVEYVGFRTSCHHRAGVRVDSACAGRRTG